MSVEHDAAMDILINMVEPKPGIDSGGLCLVAPGASGNH